MPAKGSILSVILSLVLACFSTSIRANEISYDLNITSTNAVDALNQLALQTGYSLLFDFDQLVSVKSTTLTGNYSIQEALDLMLKNTSYIGRVSEQGTISLYQKIANTNKDKSQSLNSLKKADAKLSQLNEERIDEILVTGTNIRRKTGFEGGAPIQVINDIDIQRSGALDLVDVSSLLTVNSGSTISQETGGLIGTSQFNIRGLGLGSILTLINGRRAGVSPVSSPNGVLFFDIKQLPLAMIKRIDVQTDGASSIYGSDAVGGVVNIITREGFEGLDVSARYNRSSNEAVSFDLASGFQTDRTHFNLYASAYSQTRNHRTDFDWLVERIHGDGDLTQSRLISSLGSPGSYRRAIVAGTPSVNPDTATITEAGPRFADPDCLAANGVLLGGRCTYNFADQVAPIPEENRVQLFSELSYDINTDLQIFAEASFSINKIQRTQGPNSFRNGLVDGGDIFVPADHPFNFWVDDPNDPGGSLIYIDPEDWDNSIHQAVDLVCECRPQGFEANGFDNNPPFNRDIDLNYVRGVVGFDWSLSKRLNLRGNYIYSLSELDFRAENNWDALRLNGAVLDGSFNPFGTSRVSPLLISPKDQTSLAGNSPSIISFVQNIQKANNRSLQQVMDVTASGQLFEWLGRPVVGAIGTQFRKVSHLVEPDVLTSAGLGNNPDTSSGIDASEDAIAVFSELAVPMTDDVEVQASLRHEDYGGTLGATTNPKLAARWDISDKLSLRGSWGTAFRGPSIPQVGRSTSSRFIDDPVTPGSGNSPPACGGAGQSNIATIVIEGSDRLRPESSRNFNVSTVFKPTEALDLKVDYWSYDYTDLITADEGPQAIVENDCNDDGIPNDPRVSRTSDGQLSSIRSEFINTGSVKTDGIDLAAKYYLPQSRYGDMSVRGVLSYVNKFNVKNIDGLTFDGAGNRNFNNQFGSIPQIRANASLNWELGKHSLNLGVRHIGSYENDQNPGFTINSWTAVDLQYGLDLDLFSGQETSIVVGTRNLFDRDPPSLGLGQRPAYDDQVHDIRGRSIYLGLRQRI